MRSLLALLPIKPHRAIQMNAGPSAKALSKACTPGSQAVALHNHVILSQYLSTRPHHNYSRVATRTMYAPLKCM